MNTLSRDSQCPCRSGRKYKKCHGKGRQGPPNITFNLPVQGLPGQNGKYYVVPEFPPGDPRNGGPPGGLPGDYRVVFTLARPGYPLVPEGEVKSAEQLNGTSHLRTAGPMSIDAILETGESIRCALETNSNGLLAKVTLQCTATDSQDAYHKGYKAVVRFLSLLSLRFDVPLHVYQVDTTELRNDAPTFTHRNPFLEIVVAGSYKGTYTDELRVYASLYREALITENSAYQFLCYYRIAESLRARRDRLSKQSGGNYSVPAEVYPPTAKDAVALYESIFPVKLPKQHMIEDTLGLPEALGKSFHDLLAGELKNIRDNIGHTFLSKMPELVLTDDPLSQVKVENWLPPLKLIARTMLVHDFISELI